jgi:hypothetical protein
MQMISEPKLQVSLKSVSSRAKRNCLILELHRWTGDHPVLFLLHLLLTPGKKRDGKEVRVFFGDPFNKNLTWDPPPTLSVQSSNPCVFLSSLNFWRTASSGSLNICRIKELSVLVLWKTSSGYQASAVFMKELRVHTSLLPTIAR